MLLELRHPEQVQTSTRYQQAAAVAEEDACAAAGENVCNTAVSTAVGVIAVGSNTGQRADWQLVAVHAHHDSRRH